MSARKYGASTVVSHAGVIVMLALATYYSLFKDDTAHATLAMVWACFCELRLLSIASEAKP